MMLLHAEQYLEVRAPIPQSGTLISKGGIVQVLDKGKGCVVTFGTTTRDAHGNAILYNEFSNFIRGTRNVGEKQGADRGAATAQYKVPAGAPEAVRKETTTKEQAALYRLSGDVNPLHIDPQMSAMGGFDVPILHGLCTFGIAGKHVIEAFANGHGARFKSMKVLDQQEEKFNACSSILTRSHPQTGALHQARLPRRDAADGNVALPQEQQSHPTSGPRARARRDCARLRGGGAARRAQAQAVRTMTKLSLIHI